MNLTFGQTYGQVEYLTVFQPGISTLITVFCTPVLNVVYFQIYSAPYPSLLHPLTHHGMM